jgi:hypothetical protein
VCYAHLNASINRPIPLDEYPEVIEIAAGLKNRIGK